MSGALRLDGVSKHFGAIAAVDDVSMVLDEQCIYGLVGPNGAGKSTLFDLVTGVLEVDGGTIEFDGRDVTNHKPHEITRAGLVRTFQDAKVFDDMTVYENLIAAYPGDMGPGREETARYMDLLELTEMRDEEAGNLSGGQKNLLALARAFLTDCEFVLLDEILAGVNPALQEDILAYIRRVHREEGVVFVMIEHNIDIITSMCDHVFVMNEGALLADGPPEEIQRDDAVLEAYLGGTESLPDATGG